VVAVADLIYAKQSRGKVRWCSPCRRILLPNVRKIFEERLSPRNCQRHTRYFQQRSIEVKVEFSWERPK